MRTDLECIDDVADRRADDRCAVCDGQGGWNEGTGHGSPDGGEAFMAVECPACGGSGDNANRQGLLDGWSVAELLEARRDDHERILSLEADAVEARCARDQARADLESIYKALPVD